MHTKTDFTTAAGVLSMTSARHKELRVDLERASEEMASALRWGGSPQRYSDLRYLKTAVDTALLVLASSGVRRR